MARYSGRYKKSKSKSKKKKTVVTKGVTSQGTVMKRRPRMGYVTGIPSVMKVALKYSDSFDIGLRSTNAWQVQKVFRPNDLFDPNYTDTGHQSMLRDQWYQLYEYAACIGFGMQFQFYTNCSSPVEVCICKMESETVPASLPAAIETKGNITRYLKKDLPITISLRGYTDRVLGNRKGTFMTDDSFKQPVNNTLPFKSSCWYCFWLLSRASVDADVWCRVKLVQYTRFVEPIDQIQS